MELDKLNLGCGEFKKEGFINVDWGAFVNDADVVHDLQSFPYPFSDDSMSLIEADHVLEHLSNPFALMCELHRISKDSGIVIIRTPHFSRGFSHPEHKRGFDVSFPFYFKKDFVGGFQGVEFDLESQKLRWFAQPYLKKKHFSPSIFFVLSTLGRVFDLLAQASPALCSRLWCYWVGGFEEIEFIFRTKKKA